MASEESNHPGCETEHSLDSHSSDSHDWEDHNYVLQIQWECERERQWAAVTDPWELEVHAGDWGDSISPGGVVILAFRATLPGTVVARILAYIANG
jgi:hypothetical protein